MSLRAQESNELTQIVRGQIIDQNSRQPLAGAIVVVPGTQPLLGAVADDEGYFRINNVPVGRNTFKFTCIGYKERLMNDVLVNSGKELLLEVGMEEELVTVQEVEVNGTKEKDEALNSMSQVSSRSFSVEETQKFAAAVNDPGRMAQSFAGVMSADDGLNTIVIRGNSPNALLWRMEGLEIPNPTHFSSAASSGGGISIVSAQLLSNSEFYTGAFPAEYGNALGGVFDLRLRKGNNEKREYTAQAGLLGLDIAAEGPIGKPGGGSYLINGRLSTLTLLQKFGINLGDAVTNFQDISYNISVPTEKAGNFSVFGFAGFSNQELDGKRDSLEWKEIWNRYDQRYHSNTIMSGAKHYIHLGDRTYLQSAIVWSSHDMGYKAWELSNEGYTRSPYIEESFVNSRTSLTTVLNHKWNARHHLRTGIYIHRYQFDLNEEHKEDSTGVFISSLSDKGNSTLFQAFAQWKYRISEPLTAVIGVHAMYLALNDSRSVEPRASLKYEVNERQSWSVGYGLHSQMLGLGTYLAMNGDERPNKELGFNKAHHFVLGWQQSITDHAYVKIEAYHQSLFNIAIHRDPANPMSSLNRTEGYISEPLVNDGKGKNTGLELTIEQFTHKGLYFLLSSSVFDSQYLAGDGKWRNTSFNANHSTTLTAGKEWPVGNPDKHKVFAANLRTTYAGGYRETPVDVDASIAAGHTEYDDDHAYEIRLPDYFRADVRFSLRRNREKSTSTFALDIQNVTNHKNLYGSYFDAQSGQTKEYTGVPLLPILSYKIEF
ncbi:MAG: TonB-dependent receptor [Flavobacteriales bacterium]|nr:TonB-dependent receptor [Flavobacteriales bacterium]